MVFRRDESLLKDTCMMQIKEYVQGEVALKLHRDEDTETACRDDELGECGGTET